LTYPKIGIILDLKPTVIPQQASDSVKSAAVTELELSYRLMQNHDSPFLKGIIQRILRGVNNNQIICAGKLETRLFFFLNFKGTASQEQNKTIFSAA
jgi:hypothetical protein